MGATKPEQSEGSGCKDSERPDRSDRSDRSENLLHVAALVTLGREEGGGQQECGWRWGQTTSWERLCTL